MKSPNILLMICHDLGKHLHCYGIPSVQSPNLDRLANEGVVFDNAFCTAPQCSPSRASLFTGRYPQANGMLGLSHHLYAWDLHRDERHLAGYLQEAGYHTALVGIQHETQRIDEMGYDLVDLVRPSYCRDVGDHAVAFLDSQKETDKPFYAQVGIYEPHRSFDRGGIQPDDSLGVTVPPFIIDEPSAREDFAAFQGAIHAMDTQVGRILDALEASGKADDTIVIFTTDHGMPLPLGKCTLYDPGIEIAQLIRWPARGWCGGQRLDAMTSNIDVLPTLLDAVGIEKPDRVQGKSFIDLLDGRPFTPRDRVFGQMTYHSYYDPLRCVRTEQYKLIAALTYAPFYMHPGQAYRPLAEDAATRQYPVSRHAPIELYDLEAESWEATNIADQEDYAELQAELMASLYEWMVQTDDPILKGAVTSPYHEAVLARLAESYRS